MIATIIVCFFCILFAYTHWKNGKSNKYTKEPPIYQGAWPVVGHVISFLRGRKKTWEYLQQAAYNIPRQGGTVRLYLGPVKLYVVCDPDDCLLISNKCLSKGVSYSMVKPWVGECLLTSEESIWKRDRKFLSPAYSSQILLDSFLGTFNTESKRMVEKISSEANKGNIDHVPYMKDYAINTICSIVFGDFNKKQKYMDTVESVLNILTTKLFNLFLQVDTIYDWTNIKKSEDKCINYFHETVDEIIRKRRLQLEQKLSTNTGTKETIIDLLLKSSPENVMNDVQLRDHVNMTIAAGFDTMAASMPLVLVMIGSHATVQERIYQEINEVFGDTTRDITKTDLSRLVYLEAVIKESLRFLPIVPIVARKIDEDIQLKDYTLYAGHVCVLFLRALNLHPSWGADAKEFRPERWLQPNVATDHPAAFAAFSVGRRNCIGKSYAIMSMKTAFVHLVRKFIINADWTKIEFGQDALSRSDTGHYISVKERKRED